MSLELTFAAYSDEQIVTTLYFQLLLSSHTVFLATQSRTNIDSGGALSIFSLRTSHILKAKCLLDI